MKIIFRLLPLALFLSGSLHAQNVGIGTNTPNASAKLDINANNRGLLIPNVSIGNVSIPGPVTAPATGLLVWNTNAAITGGNGTGYYYWDGSQWVNLAIHGTQSGTEWNLLGNAGTDPASNFVGTSDAQDLVLSTNSAENMRINTNGNVGIGTTLSSARLYLRVPSADASTAYGLYNYYDGATAASSSAVRSYNYGSGNGTKYGIYSLVNNEGTGGRYGIYNSTTLNSASTAAGYGMYNSLTTYGSGSQYGIYNYLTSTTATGSQYGQRTQVNLSDGNSSDCYGEYIEMDYSSGSRYGEYKDLNSNAAFDGSVYGDYNRLQGDGDGVNYGQYNSLEATGTGTQYGVYNQFAAGNTATKYGIRNEFVDETGTKYGVYNYFPSGTGTGTIYGTYNRILNDANASKYGTYNYISGGEGVLRGSYNAVYPSATNTSTCYGVYSTVNSVGTGTHYGGYFTASGTGNYGVYGSNTNSTGWAGYFNGNFEADGNSVFNESGTSDHDFRVESDTRTDALHVDAANDVVRIGSGSGSLTSNTTTISGVVVDYVADFDKGSIDGTAIGIGSIEFLLDGSNVTLINNAFAPTSHITVDLGGSTTDNGWDDVYADDFVNISDRREKEDINDLSYGLAEVMQMRPVSYVLKSDPFEERKLGLIAQEVLPVVKEAVKTHDHLARDESQPDVYEKVEMERMGMTYIQLIPVLINAVKEQQGQIDLLKREIELLKSE